MRRTLEAEKEAALSSAAKAAEELSVASLAVANNSTSKEARAEERAAAVAAARRIWEEEKVAEVYGALRAPRRAGHTRDAARTHTGRTYLPHGCTISLGAPDLCDCLGIA